MNEKELAEIKAHYSTGLDSDVIQRLLAEVERLTVEGIALEYMYGERTNEADKLRAEVERLNGTVKELQRVLEYSPTAELKMENERLRAALEKYADRKNWQQTFIYFDRWILSADGETLAQNALKGGSQ